MASVEFTILDVCHGNSTIIHSANNVVIVGAAPGSTVQGALESLQIEKIDSIIISNADADHVAGVVALLMDDEIEVSKVYVNSDSAKKTKI
ncbi:MBL fold metallo-hydrolase [Microbulbifer pacificus]|uniref:MBL fold metallo-hydrolase n=1 Tax=Microbulbifer pacificus TaxID=407164 RepID=UPI000CF40683|nr:MBL fold metallo-hydrolase [Microbulbifer pacificus]